MIVYLNSTTQTCTHLLYGKTGWVEATKHGDNWQFWTADELIRWLKG